MSTVSPTEDESVGGGYDVQPPLESAKLSRFHCVPQRSHSKYLPCTMWKLNEPQGSQTLTPVNVFPDGVEITTRGK